MAWGTAGTSDVLTLTGTYQTVQESAADLVITLNPGELATLILEFNPQASPTENCDVVILKSHDGGTTYETAGEAERYIIEYSNREADDPARRHIEVFGCHTFKIQARVRNTDDTAGGTDTASTLTVYHRTDGVSA